MTAAGKFVSDLVKTPRIFSDRFYPLHKFPFYLNISPVGMACSVAQGEGSDCQARPDFLTWIGVAAQLIDAGTCHACAIGDLPTENEAIRAVLADFGEVLRFGERELRYEGESYYCGSRMMAIASGLNT